MIDQIRRDIKALLDELLHEVDTLRRALAALTSRESEPDRGDHASAPVSGSAPAGESAGARARRTSRRSEEPAGAAAAPARSRTAQGATKAAVLAALKDGSAMTAGEIAAATGLGRATVSTTLSKLATSGEIAKAARGYQLQRERGTTRKPARPRPSASTVATSPSPQAAEPPAAESPASESPVAEPPAAEPPVVEPQAAESQTVEPPAVEPQTVEPPAVEPQTVEPPAVESQTAEPPVAEPQAAQSPVAEPQAAEPPVAESPAVESPAVESPAVEPKASGPARSAARPAPGATKHAVLAALAGGSAMTAGEVAAATGLGRASVSATLSQLAKAGEIAKAARGYQIAGVEPAQRFYFRAGDDAAPGAVAASLPELEAGIAVCEPGVLRDHCAERDFARWVAGVLHNEPLAAEIAAAEAQLSADSPTETVEEVRLALIAALQARHATQR